MLEPALLRRGGSQDVVHVLGEPGREESMQGEEHRGLGSEPDTLSVASGDTVSDLGSDFNSDHMDISDQQQHVTGQTRAGP